MKTVKQIETDLDNCPTGVPQALIAQVDLRMLITRTKMYQAVIQDCEAALVSDDVELTRIALQSIKYVRECENGF